ncbi:phosphatase PAP2 family protein [candidate division KSB1 bacterium]|nr:MAG: phosphatase PAP2 family protein [candidate division KSB1 bacterium]
MGNELSWFTSTDRAVFEVINRLFTSGFFNLLMPIVSNLVVWAIPLGIGWIVFFIRGKRRGRLIALCCFLVVAATDQLSSSVIKPVVQRNRPCNVVPGTHLYLNGKWLTTDKFGLTTYKDSFSFPSSHAANVAGQAMYWSYFYPQISPFMIFIAAAVGFSRIYMGVHWPSDVIAGYLLGIVVALMIAFPIKTWILPDD